MQNKRYLVIIGDIVKSREIIDREKIQSIFHEKITPGANLALSEMINFDDNIVSSFTVTIGDEFQGVLKSATRLFKFLYEFEYNIKHATTENIDFRYGLGVGEITTKINKNAAIGMDGPAFYNARKSIEIARANNLKNSFKSDSGNDDYINILLRWLSLENKKWSFQKFQVIHLKKDGWTQKQIAERLNISQPAVSKVLKTTPVQLTEQTEQLIEDQINSLLKEKQAVTYSMVAEPNYKYNSKPRKNR
ncbi:MAG: hypothetical protein D8M58_04845 [Calditrichaeota bacterium]|nr:MAG: hypothetical protein DWQ03_02230 [Calditrichota bacterium]MBL1204700.1 hypothetical protein [Calditrichota bacterium]NOG44528.1 hypothetical protein [Calditrichota bacterium]